MKKIRLLLIFFIILLIISGVTAFPLRTEMEFLIGHKNSFPSQLNLWIEAVYNAIEQTPDIVLYGTDWLAFAHIIIALFFIPVYIDPIRYKANLIVAMVACAAVFILAFVCGPIRGIPFFHQLIDCAFGFIGFFPLWFVYRKINQLEILNRKL
ncbi:MAG: hypothetical protein Q7W45_04345 [Bacteroidota bacterium]|nr:hypothetical protein [Bacteroidota bacterium]MDP3144678.1 hypothetical protein [Bacteroidota bacterium]MDP3557014.1 hypothetical protein [Bacteroidota bacterium]